MILVFGLALRPHRLQLTYAAKPFCRLTHLHLEQNLRMMLR